MFKRTQKKISSSVQRTYNEIATQFSGTRNRPWKEFDLFKRYFQKNKDILDIGCGNGRLLQALEGLKLNYIGVDNSKELLKQARKLHPNHKFILGDFMDLPIKNNSQDIVTCIASFHHIPSREARKKALKNIYNVLKKDGTLIITVWNLFQKKYRKYTYKSIFRSIVTLGNYQLFDTFIPWGTQKQPRYYHSFLPFEMKKYLKEAGFNLVKCKLAKGEKEASIFKAQNQIYICKK